MYSGTYARNFNGLREIRLLANTLMMFVSQQSQKNVGLKSRTNCLDIQNVSSVHNLISAQDKKIET